MISPRKRSLSVYTLIIAILVQRVVAFVSVPKPASAPSNRVPCHSSPRSIQSRLFAIKVTIRIVGRKNREQWIEDGCDMYLQRLKPANIDLATEWHKTNDALVKGVQSDWNKNVPVVLLDPKGKKCTSEKFSSDFYQLAERGGSRLAYVIGGVSFLDAPYVETNAKCSRLSPEHLIWPVGWLAE